MTKSTLQHQEKTISPRSGAHRIQIFLDSANRSEILRYYKEGRVSGFTTNPTIMRKSGIEDYEAFAKEFIATVPDLSIALEVFSDEPEQMEREARVIHSWGNNVYVKIPVTNSQGISTTPLIRRLTDEGIPVNVTALFTLKQIEGVLRALSRETPAVISVFAGRIADTGVDPMPIMKEAARMISSFPYCELLWASPREAINVYQAEECGCDIITMPPSLLEATRNFGKDLEEYSLETVQMFYRDAKQAGYKLCP